MVDNGYQRIFVPRGQVAQVDEKDDLGRLRNVHAQAASERFARRLRPRDRDHPLR